MNKEKSFYIPFNKAAYTGAEEKYLLKALKNTKMSGNGEYTKLCQKWFEEKLNCSCALLTTSCNSALDMASLLTNIEGGDEIIMPSYTFVSTANAFVLRGAKIVFVDIRPDTMNIDETKLEAAVTNRTKAIVPVHYAGVSCEMDTIFEIANKHNLFVIEDAAQGMMAEYKGRALGTIGDLGTYSFHDTKNYTSGGEGGLLLVNNDNFSERAEIIWEKGTDRSKFFRGIVDKYSWVDVGGSMLPSEIQAAYLWGQLENVYNILNMRKKLWKKYYESLYILEQKGLLKRPFVPEECMHNGHMFYIKTADKYERAQLIQFLKEQGIIAVFHYLPLHTSVAGKKYCRFHGEDKYTTQESERLLRLPLWYGLSIEELDFIVRKIYQFYERMG